MDPTEQARMARVEEINADPDGRAALEAQHGQVWSTAELEQAYTVTSFLAPFVMVTRKADGAKGSMEFQHLPRFYYGFKSA